MTVSQGSSVAGPDGSLAFDVDRARGIIFVEGKGLWTEAMVHSHFDDLQRLIQQWRADFGGARLFVDTRAGGIQSPEVEAVLRSRIMALYTGSDRVATLVAVDLRRMTVTQRVDAANRKLFDDPIAALRWLTEA